MSIMAVVGDKRFHPRVKCFLSNSSEQIVRNVSQTGFYIESEEDLELDRLISVSFTPPPEKKNFEMQGKVMRKETLTEGRFGYGLSFENLNGEDFQRIQNFISYRTSGQSEGQNKVGEKTLKILYKTISIQTQQQNLASYDKRLSEHLRPTDYFSVHNLTHQLREFVSNSGIHDGALLIQTLHTSATLAINELDEPMLLMDIVKKLRTFVPRDADYFHNSPLRSANVCADDHHCDQNADAHLKATLFGHQSVHLMIKDGELLLGHWQKIVLIDFDGPRRREVVVQATGL